MGGGSTDYSSSRSYVWKDDSSVTRKSARDYANDDKREYTGFSSEGIPFPVGKDISTDSGLVEIIMFDYTGSMSTAPKKFIEKISTIYSESNAVMQGLKLDELKAGKKVANKLEIAVIGFGDGPAGDNYPLQVVDFAKGPALTKGVNKIFPEGGGKGNAKENYELAAYYVLKHSKTPNAKKPLLLIVGDEGFYDTVRKDWVKKLTGDSLEDSLKSEDMFKELIKKFDTCLLRPNISSYGEDTYNRIEKKWKDVLGPQKVFTLRDDEIPRMFDCMITIAAAYADNLDEGIKMLERRQTPEQVKDVLKILYPLLNKDATNN